MLVCCQKVQGSNISGKTFCVGTKWYKLSETLTANYGLRKMITVAKRQYREKFVGFCSTADSGRRNSSSTINVADSLPNNLNTFYIRFKTSTPHTERRLSDTWTPPSTGRLISPCEQKRINRCNVAGPQKRALRKCANELTDVFTSIFNLYLSQRKVFLPA